MTVGKGSHASSAHSTSPRGPPLLGSALTWPSLSPSVSALTNTAARVGHETSSCWRAATPSAPRSRSMPALGRVAARAAFVAGGFFAIFFLAIGAAFFPADFFEVSANGAGCGARASGARSRSCPAAGASTQSVASGSSAKALLNSASMFIHKSVATRLQLAHTMQESTANSPQPEHASPCWRPGLSQRNMVFTSPLSNPQ
eukprot:3932013-Rhodomonas_salina.1